MFRKYSNKQLAMGLGILCVLYLLSFVLGGKGDSTFSKNLALLDTAQVSTLIISPAKGGMVTLNKTGDGWQVSDDAGLAAAPANDEAVVQAINSISDLQAVQLVATGDDKWAEYKVTDSLATRVIVKEGSEEKLDLKVGKFEYKQTGMSTYVRLGQDKKVYMVNGFLEATFNKLANDWRNKTLLKGNQAEWLTVTFNYPADSSFQLVKGSDQVWRLPDSTELDAAKVSSYLGGLANLSGVDFMETAPANPVPMMKVDIASVSGNIMLNATPLTDSTFAISSNQNPNAWFKGDAGDLTGKIFKGLRHFLK